MIRERFPVPKSILNMLWARQPGFPGRAQDCSPTSYTKGHDLLFRLSGACCRPDPSKIHARTQPYFSMRLECSSPVSAQKSPSAFRRLVHNMNALDNIRLAGNNIACAHTSNDERSTRGLCGLCRRGNEHRSPTCEIPLPRASQSNRSASILLEN